MEDYFIGINKILDRVQDRVDSIALAANCLAKGNVARNRPDQKRLADHSIAFQALAQRLTPWMGQTRACHDVLGGIGISVFFFSYPVLRLYEHGDVLTVTSYGSGGPVTRSALYSSESDVAAIVRFALRRLRLFKLMSLCIVGSFAFGVGVTCSMIWAAL